MYEFIDTTDFREQSKILPTEAVSINGEYIENLIDGYRTLYVKGRETLSPEIETGEVGIRDGSYIRSKRFPERILTIGYQIIASTETEYIEAFSKLNDILNVEDAEIIFNDERDKYLTGTPSGYSEIPAGNLNVKGEFTITCDDPFKYSIEEYEVTPSEAEPSIMVVEYNGTYPAYPVLEADFYQTDVENDTSGECGMVAFSTGRADVLQFGFEPDPDETAETVTRLVDGEITTWTANKSLINTAFNNITGWTQNDGYTGGTNYKATGTPASGRINGGNDRAFIVTSYGSDTNSQWHGATIQKVLPSDQGNPATVGAKQWRMTGTLRFATEKPNEHTRQNNGKKEYGLIRIAVLDESNKAMAVVSIYKKSGGNNGAIMLNVYGKKVKVWNNIDLSHYNRYFGFKKKKSDKRPCNYHIVKDGTKLSFNIGGKTFTYRGNNISNSVAKKVSFYIAKWGAKPAVDAIGIYSCRFMSTSVQKTRNTETWEELTLLIEQPRMFTSNDVLTADCSDGSIRLLNAFAREEINGGLHPEYGALGNDWETFTLEKGINVIGTMYSDWVADAYKPTFKLRYRERFL